MTGYQSPPLKGTVSRDFRTFSSNISPKASDSHPKIVLKKLANLQRYSSFKSPMTMLSHDLAVSMAPLSHASEVTLTLLSQN
jgi:hypothetical protein